VIAPAPLHEALARAPSGGRAFWLRTKDGVQIRIAHWPPALDGGAEKGTVLLFPGRTEYIEKYGPTVSELARRGYGCLVVDWRGQGLADRSLPDRLRGHVARFEDYQLDVDAVMAAVRALALPGPFHLLAHSMGGAIGLRALLQGLAVRSVAFSAPMWGIQASPLAKMLITMLTALACRLGLNHAYAPTAGKQAYALETEFDGNLLTNDPEQFTFMRAQLEQLPALQLAGPTTQWLLGAIDECRDLARQPAPDLPCLIALGSEERIVDTRAIHHRLAHWQGARLLLIEGGAHEILMETPPRRMAFLQEACALFDANA
jgi:lysophospholipase